MITKKLMPANAAKVATTTTSTTKSTTASTTTRKKTASTDTESEPLKQQFFVSHSEKIVTVKFGNSYFGIKKDNTLEKFMRGTETKDTANITLILDFIKKLMNANVSTQHIAERMNKTQDIAFSQTIKQFASALNKPIVKLISTKDKHPITLDLLDTE